MYDVLTLGEDGGVTFSFFSDGGPEGDMRMVDGGEPEAIRTGMDSSKSTDNEVWPFS
jgi:hypothetical protein